MRGVYALFPWLESNDVSDVLPWAGFLAFLSYDIMVMTLGITMAFTFIPHFLEVAWAHNKARLLVNCCDYFTGGAGF